MRHRLNIFGIILVTLITLAGCAKDTDPIQPDPTPDRKGTYSGTVAFTSANASVSLNVGNTLFKANEILPVSGVLRIVGGSTVNLTGSYNTANDSLYVSGGGYTFAGRFSGGQISGVCSGPNGTGIFTAAASTASNPVKVYTGEFSVPGDGDYGYFNLTVTGQTLSVIAFNRRINQSAQFTGTVQDNSLSIRSTDRVVATGTISADGSTASGVIVNSNGQGIGSWSGTLVQ